MMHTITLTTEQLRLLSEAVSDHCYWRAREDFRSSADVLDPRLSVDPKERPFTEAEEEVIAWLDAHDKVSAILDGQLPSVLVNPAEHPSPWPPHIPDDERKLAEFLAGQEGTAKLDDGSLHYWVDRWADEHAQDVELPVMCPHCGCKDLDQITVIEAQDHYYSVEWEDQEDGTPPLLVLADDRTDGCSGDGNPRAWCNACDCTGTLEAFSIIDFDWR